MLNTYKNVTNTIVNWVNRVRPTRRGTLYAMAPRSVQTNFVESLKFAGTKPFVLDPLAEASLRYSESSLVAAKPGSHFSTFSTDDLGFFFLNRESSMNGAQPPKNFAYHKMIYGSTPSQAVLLCHPVDVFVLQQKGLQLDFSAAPAMEGQIEGFAIADDADFPDIIPDHHVVLVPDVGLFSRADNMEKAIFQVELLDWLCTFTLGLNR